MTFRGGADAVLQGEAARRAVEALHLLEDGLQLGLADLVGLEGVDEHAGAQRLGEEEPVARPGTGIGEKTVGIGFAHHRQTEFQLLVVHRVAAEEDGTALGQSLGRTLEDGAQSAGSLAFQLGEAAEVESEEGAAAHGETSERALAAATRPKRRASSQTGVMKSAVATRAWPSSR